MDPNFGSHIAKGTARMILIGVAVVGALGFGIGFAVTSLLFQAAR